MKNPYAYVGTFANKQPLGVLTKESILKHICKYVGQSFEDVKDKKYNGAELTYPRQLYAYFCKKYTKETLQNIGRYINKNHSTIIHSASQIENYKEFDKRIRHDLRKLNNEFSHQIVNLTSSKRDKIGNEIILKYQK